MKKQHLPFLRRTNSNQIAQTQVLSSENLAYVLGEMGIALRYDMMAGEPRYSGEGIGSDPVAQSVTRLRVQDACLALDMLSLSRYDELAEGLALHTRFHPMEEWLRGVTWDGRDYLADLVATVETDNELWPTFLENWLVQVVEGVCGWRKKQTASLPYVLVLVGGQGVGKTHWLGQLGAGWMKSEAELHLSSAAGKDHQLEVLKYPMAELAELDGIFRKSDISHMKAFISRETDSIRAPYARRALVRPRMTCFAGSVNNAEFLTDTTGSRRFWPTQVTAIARDFEMSWEGLWAQAFEFWSQDSNYHLTDDEERRRNAIALDVHTSLSDEAERIAAYYAAHKGSARYPEVAMNRTEILTMLYGERRQFSPRTTAEAGKILFDILGKHRTLSGKQRAWVFPFNEFATDVRTWPTVCQIKGV